MADEAQHEHTFEDADASASLTYPVQCSGLRKNDHVVIKGHPCKIVDMSTSKIGENGHAKVNLVGIDIFTGRKYEDMFPSTHNMDVPNIRRSEYQLVDIADGFLSMMDDGGEMKEDVKLPAGGLGDAIAAEFEAGRDLLVTVVSAMGEEAAISSK
ncbi:Eukaryotic translation initiation factor 5A, partial [Podila epicladia]